MQNSKNSKCKVLFQLGGLHLPVWFTLNARDNLFSAEKAFWNQKACKATGLQPAEEWKAQKMCLFHQTCQRTSELPKGELPKELLHS